MSYGLKYYAEFKDYFDNDITVNIYGRDFAGASTEVKLIKESEVIINYPGDDRNLYHTIFGSQAKIKMLSESNFQFLNLHSSDSRGHRVDILKNDTLDWRGWILPDLFNEPYIAPPYPVEITARCGLGELKERDVPATMTKLLKGTSLVIDVDSFVNLYTIIGNGLLGIETSLPLNDCINLHHTLDADSNDSALFDTYVDLSMYEGMTYYEVFEDILKTFGARIYQQNGEWWIVRVDEFREELTCRKWTVNRPVNNSFVLSETKLTTFLVGKPSYSSSTGGLIVNNSPSLDILPAWKEFNIIQELKKKESIFKNSFFEDWENDYLPNTTGRLQTSFFIKDWIEPYKGFAKRHIDSEGNSFVQLEPEYTGLGLKQIISDVENLDLYAIKQKLKFKFEFDIISYDTKIETAKFAIMIKIEGLPFDYYLVPDTTSDYEFSWSTTREIIEVGNIDVSYYGGRYNRNGRVNFDWKTFEFVAPGFKSDGDLIIEILPAYRDIWTNVTSTKNIRLRLNEVSCKIVDINEIEFSEESKINTVVNSNNIYKPDDIEVLLGDLQDIPNNIHIWSNFLAKDDGDHTVDWKEKGGTTKLPILTILANDIVKRVGKPQFKLSVPILSPVIEFDSCIVDFLVPLVSGKKYLCNSASKNYQTGIFQGEYIEFSEWENLIWILAEGTWNDYGVWLDTETWNDDDSDLIEFDLIRDDEILPKIWNITTLVGIANGDTIDKLLPDSNLIFGDFLYEDTIGNEIDSVPYTFTGTVLAFRSSLTKNQSYSTYFNATISGDKKIIKINVNL